MVSFEDLQRDKRVSSLELFFFCSFVWFFFLLLQADFISLFVCITFIFLICISSFIKVKYC